ncbi:MAG: DNA-binding protein [Acetatifactor sp.]|nr:DNA-binding protein [Acetatifactor sp.]
MTRQELASNFITSMERERVRRGYTQPQMADRLGLSASGYKKIIAGETSKIDLYTAYQVYKLSGKFIFELCGENSAELEAFQDYRRLTSSQKAFVNNIIHFEQNFQENNTAVEEYISVIVPSGVAEDGMIWDSANVIKVNASPYIHRFGSNLHCGLLVTSDHLQPVYQMGDILLVSRRPPRNGDTGIFINKEEGRAYLRRYRQTDTIRLEPVNEYGVVIELNSNDMSDKGKWLKLGCILTKMRN